MTLMNMKRFDEADAAVRKSIETFKAVEYGMGVTESRKIGLQNAKAKGDEERIAVYQKALRIMSAAGGMSGRRLGKMDPQVLYKKLWEKKTPVDVMEITRNENRLVFKNLYDGSTDGEEILYRCHHINVSGVLFQVLGPEIVLKDINNNRFAPGSKGEAAMSTGDGAVHTGPSLAFFPQRHFVDKGSVIRINSAFQMYRVKRE
jgi:hypothetical protein